ncbi:MAG: NADH-quinone oxidoreductase subunit A [Pirellulaceae bacterium]|nr:NADH-quinone oxidoreductase subunit A [Planctomycetaceae bacterium]
MSGGMASALNIVAYLSLFAGVGVVFLFVNLLVGRFVRPSDPHEEKLEIYECGEPTIGSSFVQFDLRFYVVALLFIIFDVEVAFFFPWATVFGKATNLMNDSVEVIADDGGLTPAAAGVMAELGVSQPTVPRTVPASLRREFMAEFNSEEVASADQAAFVVHRGFRQLALSALIDIAVFFAVLMVGFFYVWRRGDLDWVRALGREKAVQRRGPPSGADTAQAVSV